MSTGQPHEDAAFRAHTEALRMQIQEMREKQARIAEAIAQRSQKLNRMLAADALGVRPSSLRRRG